MIAKDLVKAISNYHHHDEGKPSVVIISSPRSGSTWLMELLLSQRRFKPCDEPFNLRKPQIRERLGISTWHDLYSESNFEKKKEYLDGFFSGDVRWSFKNLLPHQFHHRWYTNRLVIKMLHAGEDMVGWLNDNYNVKILFLLRHPIAVSMSRKELPRLQAFISSDYKRFFGHAKLRYAREIIKSGSWLEKAVLDWCLQNYVPLKIFRGDLLVITYEQLVVDPMPVIRALYRLVDLDSIQKMKEQLKRPSGSTVKSTQESKILLHQRTTSGADIVNKWRTRVNEETVDRLMDILDAFDMDVYSKGGSMPKEEYVLR